MGYARYDLDDGFGERGYAVPGQVPSSRLQRRDRPRPRLPLLRLHEILLRQAPRLRRCRVGMLRRRIPPDLRGMRCLEPLSTFSNLISLFRRNRIALCAFTHEDRPCHPLSQETAPRQIRRERRVRLHVPDGRGKRRARSTIRRCRPAFIILDHRRGPRRRHHRADGVPRLPARIQIEPHRFLRPRAAQGHRARARVQTGGCPLRRSPA